MSALRRKHRGLRGKFGVWMDNEDFWQAYDSGKATGWIRWDARMQRRLVVLAK